MRILSRLRRLLTRQKPASPLPPIWEGIYSKHSDVPAFGGFDRENWIVPVLEHTRSVLDAARKGGVPAEPAGDHAILPVVLALLGRGRETLRVLDWGGAVGISYAHVLAALPAPRRIEYHVVELPDVASEGARFHAGDSAIRFHAEVPKGERFDVVYVSTALQYVADHRALLRELAAAQPEVFLLHKLSAGEIPTFATAQKNQPGASIPYWFLNAKEIESVLGELGYRLVFRSASDAIVRQENLPADRRLERAINLLFVRNA